jgi:hypothetical protein
MYAKGSVNSRKDPDSPSHWLSDVPGAWNCVPQTTTSDSIVERPVREKSDTVLMTCYSSSLQNA